MTGSNSKETPRTAEVRQGHCLENMTWMGIPERHTAAAATADDDRTPHHAARTNETLAKWMECGATKRQQRKTAIMLRRWAFIFPLIGLTGCAHDVYLMGRSSGKTGHARIVAPGTHSGELTVDIAGVQYVGRWVHMLNGGAVGFGSATAFSGGNTATAVSSFSALPAQGNGSVIAAAPDGTQLHCTFDFNGFTRTGVGLCQDSTGEVYDMQID